MKFKVALFTDEKKSELIGIYDVYSIDFRKGIVEHGSPKSMTLTRPLEGCELLQSTGLKDKNGKEIYEGDIVLFEYCGFIYSGEVSSNKFFHSCIKVGEKEYHIDNAMLGEIVGNIYKNPELLNQ